MVTFVPDFVSPAAARWRAEATEAAAAVGVDAKDWVAFTEFCAARAADRPRPKATVDDVVAHLEHVREVAGIGHVGIGGDYDGTDVLPVGLEDVSAYPRLVAALLERGWSEADLAALLRDNVLRVMRDTEAVARDMGGRRAPSLATIEQLDG